MKKIDFIIVGTMKSGTTSLASMLDKHPKIYLPKKELHYFNNPKNYSLSDKYYENVFKNKLKSDFVLGEKTPTYSYLEDIPQKIYEYNPKIKLIWIFRNPVDRAYSNYLHAVKNGSENKSFEYAVKTEKERIKQNIFFGYIRRSEYSTQIENYLRFFKNNQMHFLKLEDLKNYPDSTIKLVFEFLGVNPNFKVKKAAKKNMTYVTKYPKTLYKINNSKFPFKKLFLKLFRITTRQKKKSNMKMDSNIRKELNAHFEPFNRKLFNLTGIKYD